MEPTSSPAMASTAATDEIPPENILGIYASTCIYYNVSL